MDSPRKAPDFFDKDALCVPNNNDRFPPIALPAPPPRNLSETDGSAGEAVQPHLLESGAITHDLIVKSIIFDDQTIRKGFVRKVFGILMVQLLFTCAVMAIFVYHGPTKQFVRENFIVIILAMIVNIIVLIVIFCVESVRRKHPVNLICLSIFTFTMSLLLGAASSIMDSNVVLSAVVITTVLVTALCIYAVQTKYDYTAAGGVVITFVMILLVLSVCSFSMPKLVNSLPVSCLCAAIGCFFLIYDMQSIVGGNRAEQLDPEEYVFAALTLYVDVVRIFIHVLRIVQKFV
ncbi:protein lifeguard 1 isoform X2 [Drosophila biarmipes]|uniref:protein lifeguard 1 isoform X2 n=1 Tax=Drosophila biarmipes TaxID=125945 RepID=UPI0007E7CFEC|nr:protein lifeguard 1 isoform X2 [Drosophila biarmipes]